MKSIFGKLISAGLASMLIASSFSAVPGATEIPEGQGVVEECLASMSLRQKIGQMMMLSFRNWKPTEDEDPVPVTELNEEIASFVGESYLGGVILFSENLSDPAKSLELISQLQTANQGVPLFIAADQEGGVVSRLGLRGTGCMALGATGDTESAYEMGAIFGEELSALGLNVDLAPVMDVNSNPSNPVIGVRSFSDDPQMVAEFGCAMMEGLKSQGLGVCLKHFPGHGNTMSDSHFALPVVEDTYEELKEKDLIPFQKAIQEGADMVMTAHIQFPNIVTETYVSPETGEELVLPATLSKEILTGILREDMGFEGVICSDSLVMDAIHDFFDFNDVWRLAIQAGIDVFLMPMNIENTQGLEAMRQMIEDIAKAVEDGTIAESRIDESVRRILTLKEKKGLLELPKEAFQKDEAQKEAALAVVNSQEHQDRQTALMEKAVTLVKNENDTLPISLEEGDKVLALTPFERNLPILEDGFEYLQLSEGITTESLVLTEENLQECIEKAGEARAVVVSTYLFGQAGLDPATEDGQWSALLDRFLEALKGTGPSLIQVSCYLPYDLARYSQFDAAIAVFGGSSSLMNSINYKVGLAGLFGAFPMEGTLPVAVMGLTEDYGFDTQELYPRGYSAK